MPESIGNIIADSLELTLGYAERLLKDVTANSFARLGSTGRAAIQSNHPAFIYGHLCLYAPRIVNQAGATFSLEIPEAFAEVFSKEAQCQDDPDGKIYPVQSEVVDLFFNGYRAAVDALRAAGDDVLQQENSTAMAERFPTVGSLLNFYSNGHVMMHMGQMSAWRRIRGMGAA